jgi:hypothetical protein
MRNYIIDRLFSLIMALCLMTGVAAAQADTLPWEASPFNWRNSRYNYENSELNFSNSAKNFQNAEGTRGRLNIVNILGVVIGYAKVKADGSINYFDSDGTRIGYSVDGGKTQYDPDGEEVEFTVELQE